MPSTPSTLRIALCAAACLFAARAARADTITFQSGAGQSGGQTSKSSQSGGQSGQSNGGGQTGQVLTVDLGDVTGTVCDCGEIAPGGAAPSGASSNGGSFPRLPLLAFAAAPAIPCLFTDLCRNTPPPPSITEPPPSVPEPLTVITFATGLGALAALRRRWHN